MSDDDYGGMSLFDLFAQETDAQAALLADGLLTLERTPDDATVLESCMRAAHSLKGAARIVGVDAGVAVAHVMEECFVLAQHDEIQLTADDIDVLLNAVDLLRRIAEAGDGAKMPPEATQAAVSAMERIAHRGVPGAGASGGSSALAAANELEFGAGLSAPVVPSDLAFDLRLPMPPQASPAASSASDLLRLPAATAALPAQGVAVARKAAALDAVAVAPAPVAAVEGAGKSTPGESGGTQSSDRTLRVAAENLDRLLALSGQAVVEARTLRPLVASLMSVLQRQRGAALVLQQLRTKLVDAMLGETMRVAFDDAVRQVEDSTDQLAERIGVFETFDLRHLGLSNQIYESALASRMRPFGDITGGYARMVREVARSLGKQVRLTIIGEATQVDRDILSLLDAPIGHLLRNAVDHGTEAIEQRLAAGKSAEGLIRIEARHVAGTLVIEIDDDGAGIDIEAVRAAVIRRGLVKDEVAARLSEAELLEFLMLPGFSMREQVTEVSGRGVGLDVVQTSVRQVRGSIRISQVAGVGTRFRLQLPLTLSVMRCLLADVNQEPYAFPLAHVTRALRVPAAAVETLEGRPHFTLDGKAVALVLASQAFRSPTPTSFDEEGLSVIIFGDADETYGLVVDCFRDERMLVVQPLDPRLGKVSDIAAASLMEDGAPVLIVDVEDLMRSMARLASVARVEAVARVNPDTVRIRRQRVLVVDDSLTVRELQRKLLSNGGYDVTVAVDGMEGWNALMAERFDLVVTDVDMPRLDGIELVTMIRRDAQLRTLPVMIVSYKDRPADRQRGLDAGADYYLAKSSFHDAALLDAVKDLIGEAAG
jgi:two-component system sensor histidine kinase and response regulator WspE